MSRCVGTRGTFWGSRCRHIPTHWPIVLTALLLTISTSNDNCFWSRKLIIHSCSVFFVKQDRYHCVTYPVGIRTTPPSWQCIHTRTLAEFGYNGPLWPGGACAPQQSIVQCFLGRAVNTNSSVVVQSHWRKGWIFIDRFENWLVSRELFLMGNPGKFENYNDTLPLSVKTYKTWCM